MQKSSRPKRTLVLPKSFKLFLHQVRPNRSQVVSQQFLQLGHLLFRQVFRVLQENIFALRQHRLAMFLIQFHHVQLARFIHCLRQMSFDVQCFPVCLRQNLSSIFKAFGQRCSTTFKYCFHISLHTNSILSVRGSSGGLSLLSMSKN